MSEEEITKELRELLATFIDAAVLPGHIVSRTEWNRACLLCGRYCAPFIDDEDDRSEEET